MKAAAVFPQQGKVGLVQHEAPALLSPTEVKLRMLEVGICGTDKEICSFKIGTPPPGFDYLVLGHESLGEVVETGPSVSRVRPGDLVTLAVLRPCSHAWCPACRAGRQDFCVSGDFTERGIKEQHGFLTEFVVDDEQYMHAVPRELREVAVLVEPLTIAEKALIQADLIRQRTSWNGSRAVVLGAGPVGLLGAMALVLRGFNTYVYSREPAHDLRAGLTEAIGAQYICSQAVSIPQMAAEVGNIDLVYEATGAAQMAFEVLGCLGYNSIFILTGVPGHSGPVHIDTDVILRNLVLKNQVVLGTVNSGHDAFAAAIRDLGVFAARWPKALAHLITGRYPIERFCDLVTGQTDGIKNVVVL